MDSEICTACGRQIPFNASAMVRNGRVICPNCAMLEAAQTSTSKGPRQVAPKIRQAPVSVSSRTFARSTASPSYRAPADLLGLFWVGLYLTGLVAAFVQFNQISIHGGQNNFPIGQGSIVQRTAPGGGASAGPCQVSIRHCVLDSLVLASNVRQERILVFVRIHNTSESRAVPYSSWRITGSKYGFNKSAISGESLKTRLRNLIFFGNQNSGNHLDAGTRFGIANTSIPGFEWQNCHIPPHGTIYDVLQFTTNTPRIGRMPLLLSKKNLGISGNILFRIKPTIQIGITPFQYALRNQSVIGGANLPGFPGLPGSFPPRPPQIVKRVIIPNLNQPSRPVPVLPPGNTAQPLDPLLLPTIMFNSGKSNSANHVNPLPATSVRIWNARVDAPLVPLGINLRGHVVIPFNIQPFYSSPQGAFLGGQTWFSGRFLHFYAINLRTASFHLVISTPAATVLKAVISPDGHYIAAVDIPFNSPPEAHSFPGQPDRS